MRTPKRATATGRGRRLVFRTWVALTVVAAVYITVTGPLVTTFAEDMWLVAIAVPPLMILLLGLGLGWLVWLVTAPRRHRGRRGPAE